MSDNINIEYYKDNLKEFKQNVKDNVLSYKLLVSNLRNNLTGEITIDSPGVNENEKDLNKFKNVSGRLFSLKNDLENNSKMLGIKQDALEETININKSLNQQYKEEDKKLKNDDQAAIGRYNDIKSTYQNNFIETFIYLVSSITFLILLLVFIFNPKKPK